MTRVLDRLRRMLLFSVLLLLCTLFGCTAGSHERGPFSLSDERLLPFKAMLEIDRDAFCLTGIDADSKVNIDTELQEDGSELVILEMAGEKVDRVVTFAREDGQYVWIGEHEVHKSGRTFVTPDGELSERIAITYHDREYGIDCKRVGLTILYIGEDPNIPTELTCEQARSLVVEWNAVKAGPGQD